MDSNSDSDRSGASTPATIGPRTSVEEDYFYREVMTITRTPSERPPAYDAAVMVKRILADRIRASIEQGERRQEALPEYSCDINCEGVFMRKMEIQNTTKRAEDRHWATMFLELNGTALNAWHCKKDRAWRKAKGAPKFSADNPPWMKRTVLAKSYSLAYADAGIAADYQKYVFCLLNLRNLLPADIFHHVLRLL